MAAFLSGGWVCSRCWAAFVRVAPERIGLIPREIGTEQRSTPKQIYQFAVYKSTRAPKLFADCGESCGLLKRSFQGRTWKIVLLCGAPHQNVTLHNRVKNRWLEGIVVKKTDESPPAE